MGGLTEIEKRPTFFKYNYAKIKQHYPTFKKNFAEIKKTIYQIQNNALLVSKQQQIKITAPTKMTLQHPACSSDGNNITTISLSNDYKAFWLYNKYFRCNVCKTNKRQKKKL